MAVQILATDLRLLLETTIIVSQYHQINTQQQLNLERGFELFEFLLLKSFEQLLLIEYKITS